MEPSHSLESSYPTGPGRQTCFSIQDGPPLHLEEQPSCGLNWAAVFSPSPGEETARMAIPLELSDVQVALDDDPNEETPRPGGFRESGLCLALSASMHCLLIAIMLYFTSYASGLAGMPGPGLGNMMVGLYEGLGDPLEDGGGEAGPDAPGGSEDPAELETSELPPEPEPAGLDLEKIASPPEPDPEAIALEPPKPRPEPKKAAKKAETRPKKAAAPAAKKPASGGLTFPPETSPCKMIGMDIVMRRERWPRSVIRRNR